MDDASEDKCWEGGCNTAKAAGSNFCAVHKQAPVVASVSLTRAEFPVLSLLPFCLRPGNWVWLDFSHFFFSQVKSWVFLTRTLLLI